MTGAIPQALWDDGRLQDAGLSLQHIESAIKEMATRLAGAGASPAPVLRARYDLAVHRFGHAAAQDAFDEWVAAVADRNAAAPAPIASAAAGTNSARDVIVTYFRSSPRLSSSAWSAGSAAIVRLA